MLELSTILQKIKMSRECTSFVLDLINNNNYQSYVSKYYINKFALFEEIQQREDWRQWFLGLFCFMSPLSYAKFKLRYPNISDDIYFDTLQDITLWAEYCYKKFGIWGIENIKWISHTIDLNLFRFGRLQFRLCSLANDYNVEGYFISKEKILISVHVPSGGKLDYQECVKSFKQAFQFFVGADPIVFCKSWLIDERITPYLKPDSNILKFQKLFKVVAHEDSQRCEEYVFNEVLENKSAYTVKTSLQRELKKYLENGGTLGVATGFLFLENLGDKI